MAVAYVRDHLETNVKAAGTNNLSFTLGAVGSDAGNLLIARIVFDNLTATTPVVNSIGKPANETANWVRVASHDSPQAGTAAGVRSEIWVIRTTVAWAANGAHVITFSVSIAAKACQGREFSGVTDQIRGTAGTGTSTAGTPSATTGGTAPIAGDLVLGMAGFENKDPATQDTDTLNGSWSVGNPFGTSGGSSVTNVQALGSYKIVTAGGHQTYNPVGTGDSGACVVALKPAPLTATVGQVVETDLAQVIRPTRKLFIRPAERNLLRPDEATGGGSVFWSGVGTLTLNVTPPVALPSGNTAIRLVGTGLSQDLRLFPAAGYQPSSLVTPELPLTVRLEAHTVEGSRQVEIKIEWYDSSDVLVSTSQNTVADNTTGWTLVALTATPPPGAVKIRTFVTFGSGSGTSTNYVGDLQFAYGTSSTYFPPNPERALRLVKSRALGQTVETDLAQPVTFTMFTPGTPVNQASETDLAQRVHRARGVRQASETDLAQPVARVKSKAVGQAAETDAAQLLTKTRSRVLGQPGETDSATATGRAKRKALAQVGGASPPAIAATSALTEANLGATANFNVAWPSVASLVAGDVLYAFITQEGYSGIDFDANESGWTDHGTVGVGSDAAMSLFSHVVTQADIDANKTSSPFYQPSQTQNRTTLGRMVAMRGSGVSLTLGLSAAVTGMPLASRAVSDTGTLYLAWGASTNTGTFAFTGDFVELFDDSSGLGGAVSGAVAYRTANPGDDNAVTITATGGLHAATTAAIGSPGAAVPESSRPVTRTKSKALGQATETDLARALVFVLTATVNQVLETDLAQSAAKVKSRTVGQTTEADLAQVVARVKTRTLGQTTETDLAQPVIEAVIVKRVTETDLAQPVARVKTRGVAQATQTDLTQPVARRKSRAVGQSLETDTAQKVSRARGVRQSAEVDLAQVATRVKSKTLGQATETDLAQAVAKARRYSVAQALETDLAQAVARRRSRSVAQNTESDLAQVVTRVRSRTLGQNLETDTAQRIFAPQLVSVAQVVETDTAQPVGRIDPIHRGVVTATETDLAQAVARTKRKALAQTSEADLAQAVGRTRSRALGQPTETDTVTALARRKTRTLAQVTETDLAQAVARTKRKAIGQNLEADAAGALTELKHRTLGQPIETDSVTRLGRARSLGLTSETDTAQRIFGPIRVTVNQALESDAAQPVGKIDPIHVGVVGPAETDTAGVLARVKTRALAQASETDSVTAVARLKTRTLGLAVETNSSFAVGKRKSRLVAQAVSGSSDPASISGLEGWWRPETLSYTDGQVVTSWPDSSGNGRNLSAVDSLSLIKYRAAGINGYGAVDFTNTSTGTTSRLEFVGTLDVELLAQQYTIFVVHDITGSTDSDRVAVEYRRTGGSGGEIKARLSPGGNLGHAIRNASNTIISINPPVPSGAPLIQTGTRYSDGQVHLHHDGSAVAAPAASAGDFGVTDRVHVGETYHSAASPSSQSPFNGKIAEVLVYDRDLTAGERAIVHSYLQDRYAIAVSDYVASGEKAQSLARVKSRALGQASETDTVTALTRTKSRTLGQVLETDTANRVFAPRSVLLAQAVEADSANPIGKIDPIHRGVTGATETDAVTVLGRIKSRALGQTVETDSVTVLGRVKSRTPGQTLESDLAQSLARTKVKAIGQAFETDLSQNLARAKRKALGQVTESDTAGALTRLRRYTLGLTSESDLAQAVTKLDPIHVTLGIASETDTALAVSTASNKNIPVTTALETDSTTAVGRRKAKGVAQTTQTEAAQALGRLKARTLGQASEADAAGAVARSRSYALGLASSPESSQGITRVHSRTLGLVSESDAAGALARAKARTTGQPTETDLAQPVTKLDPIRVVLGQASETDLAFPVSSASVKNVPVVTALETDSAGALARRKTRTLGQVSEIQTVASVGRAKTRSTTGASESDTVGEVRALKRVQLTQLVEADTTSALRVLKTLGAGQAGETDLAFEMVLDQYVPVGQAVESDSAGSWMRYRDLTLVIRGPYGPHLAVRVDAAAKMRVSPSGRRVSVTRVVDEVGP